MQEVTSHAQGAPSWAELDTTDEIGALSFYSALFGWEDDPQEIVPGWFYHMQRKNGLAAASIYRQSEEELAQNVPPHWNTYFTVSSVDETVKAVGRNGGSVVFGPADVFEAGRMAMCRDPQGAHFAIWQANQHIGCQLKLETEAMFWNELLTTDSVAAIDFYIAVLGMERGEVALAMDYPMLRAGGTEVVGISQINPDMGELPPYWVAYFGVDNLDATVAQSQSLGATVFIPPADIVKEEGQPPVGRFAHLADPQGAAFALMQDMPQTPGS